MYQIHKTKRVSSEGVTVSRLSVAMDNSLGSVLDNSRDDTTMAASNPLIHLVHSSTESYCGITSPPFASNAVSQVTCLQCLRNYCDPRLHANVGTVR
jgi:hypothetical protein